MVWLAFSLQDQVEKYGAYVGIAAFLGLAVLSLLYFAQARELKRLRDWAGRAPERAAELQARVVAQAEESLRVTEEPEVERAGNGVPDKPPTEIPRATPRPQPKPRPVPAAAPLRASTTRSTTLPPSRRARRGQRDGQSRAGLYTLIGIV